MNAALLPVAFLVAFFSALAQAASFPCDKAQSAIEKTICADARLSDLDEYLARYYFAARESLRESATCLADDQRQWLRSVRNACADGACLKRVYLDRLGELHALQPGATALRTLELPRVPSLVWIVPPAADTVAAPPKPNARPLVARGTIVNDMEKGDGFVLRSAEGDYLLVLAMFLDGATPERLAHLATLPDARFSARGHAAGDGKRIYYEPSRCLFIHQLP